MGALPTGEGLPGALAARWVPVIARLADPSVPVPGLRTVARFGQIVSGRVPAGQVVRIHRHPNVLSLKASRQYVPALEASVPDIGAVPAGAGEALGLPPGIDGSGTVIGLVDWGVSISHKNFRNPDGSSRLCYLWDQRGGKSGKSPAPFGYGREFTREAINRALGTPDPYAALGYDPADADPGSGSHGTVTLDIAAGNGRAPGASPGVAPGADLIFVHLRGDDTRPQDVLGDSVRLFEAVAYIVERAGNRPTVVNCSLGRTGSQHKGKTLFELGLDALIEGHPGLVITMSTGNYFESGLHAAGRVATGSKATLAWKTRLWNGHDEMEIWYSGIDAFEAVLVDPAGWVRARVPLGKDRVVRSGGKTIATVYHRQSDPNSGDHQVNIFLWPDAPAGTWQVVLEGHRVANGRFEAWIERIAPHNQSRFAPEHQVAVGTTNTICNGRETIATGAYDARSADLAIAHFSSVGPHSKPVVSAPGVGIRAARSSRIVDGERVMDELTVMSGTSMAAPHVAGVVACMLQAAAPYRPTAREVRQILVQTAREPEARNAIDRARYGAGMINAAAAVAQAARLGESLGEAFVPAGDRKDKPLALPLKVAVEGGRV